MRKITGQTNQLHALSRPFKAWFKGLNLKKKLVVITTAIFLVVFGSSVLIFQMALKYVEKQTYQMNLENTYQQKGVQFEEYLARMDEIAYSITFSNWVQELYQGSTTLTASAKQMINNNASHFLSSISAVNNDIRFALISTQGETIQNNSFLEIKRDLHLEEKAWYQGFLEEKRYVECGESSFFQQTSSRDKWLMTIYYPITDYYDFQLLGYLVIGIEQQKLSFLSDNLTSGQRFMVTDKNGHFIVAGAGAEEALSVSTLEEVQKKGFVDKGNQSILHRKFSPFDWNSYIVQLHSKVVMDTRQWEIAFIILIPLGVLVIAIAVWFSQYLTTPIIVCKNAILAIRNNQFGIQIENHYYDEIGELIDGFNEMSGAVESLIAQNKTMDVLKREAEFDMLQQKINPHFLYNTLEIINGLIAAKETERAMHVCEVLGLMFRYNLNDQKRVLLRDEYEYICRYLSITKYKRADLEVTLEVQEHLLEQRVLKFILQPLVENCIKHGFRNKTVECCLTLTIKEEGNKIHICIMDNGCGILPEKKAELERQMQSVRRQSLVADQGHIGVLNVYQRMCLEYGSKFDFHIITRPGRGTKLELIIPKGERESV